MCVNKKRLLLLVLITAILLPVFANSLVEVMPNLSDEEITSLLEGNLLTNDTTKSDDLIYVPTQLIQNRTTSIKMKKDNEAVDAEDEFSVEAISLISYPEFLANASNEQITLQIINTLRAVSTQEGITYISYRRGNIPYPLFTKSFRVDRVGSRQPLEDPILTHLPFKIEDIVYQKDTSFSGNYYKFTYAINDDFIYLTVENLTTMAVFGLIPAVPKNTLKITFFITPINEGIICYTQANIVGRKPELSILGFSVHLPSAFQRRITALQEWFAANIS